MLTGIPRRLNVSFLVAIAVFVLACGVYAAKAASSYGATVSGGSAGPLSGFPVAGHDALPFVAGGSAVLSRSPEGAFGSFSRESPQALAVDQASGDVYALDTSGGKLLRFTSSGAPADFTAGPGATTNEISGLSFQEFASIDQVAVDNSGGPSDGDVYVTQSSSGIVKVFSSDGEPLGTLTGEKTPEGSLGGEVCGVAVDQSNGDLYVASYNNRIWRYLPSGAMVAEKDYSGGISTTIHPCSLAVAKGVLYAKDWEESPTVGGGAVDEYETAAFEAGVPSVAGSQIAGNGTAVATDATGDAYVDEGKAVSVFDPEGTQLYSFATNEVGGSSAGVAVRSDGEAYVSDATTHEIHVYGPTLEAGGRADLGSFGSFSGESPQALAVDQASGDVYAIDSTGGELLRFTSSGTPADFSAGPGADTNAIGGMSFGHFPSIDQVAVDNSGGSSDGNVYVTQSASETVKVFSSSGEPLGTLNGSGTPTKNFGGATCGVAVDQSNGDVYVASRGSRVWRYSPSGAVVTDANYSGGIETTLELTSSTEPVFPCEIAVAKGRLYVKDWHEKPILGGGRALEYPTAAFALGKPSAPAATTIAASATAVATDPSDGDVYVDEADKVSVLTAEGEPLYQFGAEEIGSSSTGVAVRSDGDAYVSDSTTHQIHVFGPFSAPPPIVETKPASAVKHVKATLNGHLDPNNGLPITGCRFEWGTDTSYTETPVPCAQGETFTAASAVTAELAGLTPGTNYHYRLHVTTGASAFDGEDESFETPPASSTPEVTTGTGTTVSGTSTRMEGTIDPEGNPLTGCHFEYVADTTFQVTGFSDLSSGASVPCEQDPGSIPTDFEDHPVTATATGLDPNQNYRYRLVAENLSGSSAGTPVLLPGPPIVETTGSPTRTTTTARLDSRVNPHGAATSYWFEYTPDADYKAHGFEDATSTPQTAASVNTVQHIFIRKDQRGPGEFKLGLGAQTTQALSQSASGAEVQAALELLPGIGQGNVRVELVEPLGDPRSRADYYVTFQGALGDTKVEALNATTEVPTPVEGIGVIVLVSGGFGSGRSSVASAYIAGLQPATTYDYRMVTDNGTPGGPTVGSAMRITTRDSEAPLSHGHFPGPPGSDRAWEQVNFPDTDGNPVNARAIAPSGERVVYAIDGGSPGSAFGGETAGNSNDQFAERTPDGWLARDIYPTRAQAPGNIWQGPFGSSELTVLYADDYDETHVGDVELWRMSPGSPAEHVFGADSAHFNNNEGAGSGFYAASENGSRVISTMFGTNDPSYPLSPETSELYDLSSGTPKLIGLLPDGSAPTCGVTDSDMMNNEAPPVFLHTVTPDGSHAFFQAFVGESCAGSTRGLYDRDLVNSTTTLITSQGRFIRYTAGYVFFVTDESLEAGDPEGNDIYSYRVADHTLHCLTCSIPGGGNVVIDTDQQFTFRTVAVADDGSRIYFSSSHRLLAGAEAPGIYRLDVASGALAYVAPAGFDARATQSAEGGSTNSDGSVLMFSSANPGLNAINGQQSGGTLQYYRYDDRNRSLICVSCPGDGSLPHAEVDTSVLGVRGADTVDAAGDVVFTTPTPLSPADQNTAAAGENVSEDIYEWRDGRLLLVTDGRTSSTSVSLDLWGISASGRDVFFSQAAKLTPDAPDASKRLYDARVGGGFEFHQQAPPCPLEACQPSPSAPSGSVTPGSSAWSGPGNPAATPPPAGKSGSVVKRCPKDGVLKRGKCVKKPPPHCPKNRRRRHGRCVKVANHARRANNNQRGVK